MQVAIRARGEAEDRLVHRVACFGLNCRLLAIATLPASPDKGSQCGAFQRSTTLRPGSMRSARSIRGLNRFAPWPATCRSGCREPGFASLASIIVSQQVSRASADAIFGRLTRLVDPLTPEALLARRRGDVSRGRAVARPSSGRCWPSPEPWRTGSTSTISAGSTPRTRSRQMTAVSGIGPWTAEVYLLFSAGHPDIFPARDVALQTAVGHALGIDAASRRKGAYRNSPNHGRPGAASRRGCFWAYYRETRGRDGAPPAQIPEKNLNNRCVLRLVWPLKPLHIPVMSGLQYLRRSFDSQGGRRSDGRRISGWASSAGAECGLPSAQLLPAVALVLAGRHQGGVPRPGEHRRRIRAPGLVADLLDEAAERRQPEKLCEAVAAPGLHPVQRVPARPLPVPVLRHARGPDLRPCRAAPQRRRDDLGERRGRLLALQSAGRAA